MLALRLLDRQLDPRHGRLQQEAGSHFLSSQPALWREEEITHRLASWLDEDGAAAAVQGPAAAPAGAGPGQPAAAAQQCDKAFAMAWQDDRHLLVGTKCNKLLQWDTATGRLRRVPLPALPLREHEVLATVWGSCGIHTVAINPSGDMVATGGAEPADCVVMRLPDFRPVQTLAGHLDWVFGAAWVSDRHVVTGSRDQSVALWSLPEAGSGAPEVQYKFAKEPDGLQRKFEGKVRDVKYDFEGCRLAALSTEGSVKLMDPARNLHTVRTVKLPHTKELVCLEQRQDLLAVGSVGHVTLLDPRRRNAELRSVASPDDNQGVRSIQLNQHLLSFGTGRGKLFFYDLRAQAFLPTETARYDYSAEPLHSKLSPPPPPSWQPRQHLQLGNGYFVEDELYYDHFEGMDIKHACYAHKWDATGSRLFVCGGPLAFGLKGCYMAVWH